MFNAKRVSPHIKAKVPVEFTLDDGSVMRGDFTANFNRLTQERIDELLEDDMTPNSVVFAEAVASVEDIFDGENRMEPAAALQFVTQSPECVAATVKVFFEKLRPADTGSKTSKKRR
jgi:hypothetical protein